MRRPEIIMLVLSLFIIALAGVGPLIGSHDSIDVMRQECELFYGQGGPASVSHCMTEMAGRRAER